jgi:two-component system, response regulator PdtaR
LIILIIEDDVLIAMSLDCVLSDAGHSVEGPVATATDALALAERTKPDLALVDINLRDKRGAGVDLARQLLARWNIPSLFLSAQTLEAHSSRDAALGLLGKPFTDDAVLGSVKLAEHLIRLLPPPPPVTPFGLTLFV